MRKETSEWSIRMLVDFENRINVDAEYQRGKVWSEPQQALLIDSILRNFDIPKIFLRKRSDHSNHLFDVIDGKQRLTAIWRFASGHFRLLRNSAEFPELGNLGGKCWSELPQKAQDKLQFSHITVSNIEEATEDEIHELFLRLQQGEPLNAAERRNAIAGPVRDFVADRLVHHPVWRNVGIRSARFGLAEHSAIVLALTKKGGPVGLKGADLQGLYEVTDFDPKGEIAERASSILDKLDSIAAHRPGTIRTRWGLVDLTVVLLMLEQNDLTIDSSKVMDFYKVFEEQRRAVGGLLSDLQTKLVSLSVSVDEDTGEVPDEIRMEIPGLSASMLTYYLAFTREGATQENVKTRSQIMYQHLMEFLDSARD